MMNWLFVLFSRQLLRHPPTAFRVTLLLSAVLSYGASGFLYFELPANPSLTWSDAIWYAVVTVTTVGYGDYSPATLGGRFLIAAPMMFFGIGLLGYVLSLAASALVEQKSKESRGMGQFDFSQHLVICNFPHLSVVERVLDELWADPKFERQRGIVLIDADMPELPPELVKRGVHFVRGEPSRDETLVRANIDEAKYAVVLSKRPSDPGSDMQNVATILALEVRNPKVYSVSQCIDPSSQELMYKAGCDRVVCTGRFDAHFLAAEMLSPGIQDIIADLTSAIHGEQIYITPYRGARCKASALANDCRREGHLLIGIQRKGETHLNLADDFELAADDAAITIGAKRLALG